MVEGNRRRKRKIRKQVVHQPFVEEPGVSAWKFVLGVFLVSRLLYLSAGAISARIIENTPQGRPPIDRTNILGIWATWDGVWYTSIAKDGYGQDPDSTAFFPLYPILTRLVTQLFGDSLSVGELQVWGVIISLISFLFALYFVYRIAEDGWDRKVAQGTILVLAFFPTAYYFNAMYSESLFLALSAGAIWAARIRSNLLLASLLAGLATATRNVGILLFIPLGYEWIRGIGYYRWRGVYLTLVPLGLIAYMGFLWHSFGNPLIFQEVQEAGWDRTFTANPFTVLNESIVQAQEGARWALSPQALFSVNKAHAAMRTYDLLFLMLLIVLLSVGFRYLPLDLYLFGLLLTLPLVFYGQPDDRLYSLPRFMLVSFPLFITLGVFLKNRWALVAWLIPSTAVSLFFCALFVSWRWVA